MLNIETVANLIPFPLKKCSSEAQRASDLQILAQATNYSSSSWSSCYQLIYMLALFVSNVFFDVQFALIRSVLRPWQFNFIS